MNYVEPGSQNACLTPNCEQEREIGLDYCPDHIPDAAGHPLRQNYTEADTRRRENLSKPTRDYPGPDQMMAWQALK